MELVPSIMLPIGAHLILSASVPQISSNSLTLCSIMCSSCQKMHDMSPIKVFRYPHKYFFFHDLHFKFDGNKLLSMLIYSILDALKSQILKNINKKSSLDAPLKMRVF